MKNKNQHHCWWPSTVTYITYSSFTFFLCCLCIYVFLCWNEMAPDESHMTSAWEVEHVSWMSACRGVFAEETGTVWQQHVKILHWKSCQCEKRITHATGLARTLWDVHQVEDRSCFHHPVVAMTTLRFCYAEQTLVVCPRPSPIWGCRTCEDICTS